MGKISICAPNKNGSGSNDNVELSIDGAMGFEGYGPNNGNEDCDTNLNQRSDGVGTAVVEQHVMQVCLVGFEGGIAFHNASEHHTQCVSHWNSKDSECQRDKSQMRIINIPCPLFVVVGT